MNNKFFFDSKYNYLARKILLALISIVFLIIIILQFSMFSTFSNRITIEYDWIVSSKIENIPFQPVDKILQSSTSYQLKDIFYSLNSLTIIFSFIILALLVYIQIRLYKQVSNGDKLFIYLFVLIPVVFVFLFAINSLQPDKVFRLVNFEDPDTGELKLIQQPIQDKINYTRCWISMIFAFICIILIIITKKKLGFINKDKILQKSLINTQELKENIRNILKSESQN